MYTTVDEVLQTLPAVGSVTTINSATIASFIAAADAIINTKLSESYAVPVSGEVPLLTLLSTEITLYRLLTRRIFTQEQSNKSDWPDRYKEAIEMLDQIVEGKLSLVDSAGSIIGQSGAGAGEVYSNTMNYTPTFSEDGFESSGIDSEKLLDIYGDRL